MAERASIQSKIIPFFVHWIKYCYRFCEKPLTQCLTTGEIDRYLNHISKRKEQWHSNIRTRMIYTHVAGKDLMRVQSPLDER